VLLHEIACCACVQVVNISGQKRPILEIVTLVSRQLALGC
jgi:hypothetical protein